MIRIILSLALFFVAVSIPVSGKAQDFAPPVPISSNAALEGYGLTLVDPIEQETQDLQEQASPNSVPQDETVFNGQMCIRAGRRGAEIEDCVRDTYLWRRGQ